MPGVDYRAAYPCFSKYNCDLCHVPTFKIDATVMKRIVNLPNYSYI